METVAVVLSVGKDRVEAFESGFREHELPVWQDLEARGLLTRGEGRSRRSRSRRGAKTAAPETAGDTVEPAAEASVAAVEAAAPERPPQEAHLRQSDRRGARPAAEPQRSNGRPFGESEVPAFLRRPVSIKG